MRFKIVDEVIPEPLGGAQKDPDETARNIKAALLHSLQILTALPTSKLLENRFEKFRSIGAWQEKKPARPADGPASLRRKKKAENQTTL